MSVKHLFETVLNLLPWREESQYLAFRDEIEETFPDESQLAVEAGVKDSDGQPVQFPPIPPVA